MVARNVSLTNVLHAQHSYMIVLYNDTDYTRELPIFRVYLILHVVLDRPNI